MISDSELAKRFWEEGRLDDCPVIDMHGHMGPWPAIYFPRAEPERMLESMDQAGVTRLFFSSHEALFNPATGNDYTLRVARKYPDRFRGYFVINGNQMDVVERDLARFDECRDAIIGFKFLSAYHRVRLDDSRYDGVWSFANERKLVVKCHTWGNNSWNGPDQVRNVVSRYPEVRMQMGHSLYGEWEKAAALATEFPHVYLDLTAVFECRGALELFEEKGAGKRMLFGTDLPWFSPLHGIGCVLSAEISDETRRDILYRNAQELVGHLMQ